MAEKLFSETILQVAWDSLGECHRDRGFKWAPGVSIGLYLAQCLVQTGDSRKHLLDQWEKYIHPCVWRKGEKKVSPQHQRAGWHCPPLFLIYMCYKSAEQWSQCWSIVTFINCVPNKWGTFISAREVKRLHQTTKQTSKQKQWMRGSLMLTGPSLYHIKDVSSRPQSYQEI